ncbi:MAG: aldo/keto reductase [Candidatus Fimadaptatus sp.]
MDKIQLGRTGLTATSVSFGALPVQRRNMEDGVRLLRSAYDNGVRFFDTARAYSDSEEKIGNALSDVRHDIVITSKSPANNGADYMNDLETSLRMLKTDYIDVYQFHNKQFTIAPGGADGLYDAALKAKQQGKIRFIGLTQHSLEYANEAVDSGNFDTLQFPFSYLASDEDVKLVDKCLASGMGFIAMKALSGGLLTNARAIHAFMRAHPGVVPIYGIQRQEELDEFLAADREGVTLDDELRAVIEKDRRELIGSFCRGCGYCMPCPVGIPLNNASRLIQLLTRSPIKGWMTPEFKEQMDRVENCTHCGVCATRCPYHLKPYELIPESLKFYRKLYAEFTAQKEG